MVPAEFYITSKVISDGEEEVTEFFTVGEYGKRKGVYTMRYDETEGIGYENCTVTITVDGDCITIRRTGPAASTLTAEKGVKHHCVYGTPFGDFTMGINTYDVKNDLENDDEGKTLWFKYSIDINNDFVSENEMLIRVRSEEQAT